MAKNSSLHKVKGSKNDEFTPNSPTSKKRGFYRNNIDCRPDAELTDRKTSGAMEMGLLLL